MNMKILTIIACLLAFAISQKRVRRMIGGRDAQPGEFLHQVRIEVLMSGNNVPTYLCGGSVLSDKWIVTAAHCVDERKTFLTKNYLVKTGKHDLRQADSFQQMSNAEEIFVHQDYTSTRFQIKNDIALIKMVTAFIFNDRVKLIALPTKYIKPGSIGTLSSWGSIKIDTNPEYPTTLKTMDGLIMDHEMCSRALNQFAIQNNIIIIDQLDETVICTKPLSLGSKHQKGDSGSPLILKKRNDMPFELVGIVSGGYRFNLQKEAPSMFTSVYFFVDWIKKTITNDCLKTTNKKVGYKHCNIL